MVIIILFILILNIVSIVLMYYSLGDLTKKEKLIYIVVGTAIMYMLTSIVYWLSTRDIEITEVSERGKDLITFLFVPINGIIILPLLAKSYNKLKYGNLDKSIFLKRGLLLGIVLIIALIIECMYFKNIQEQVVTMLNQQSNLEQEETNVNAVTNELVQNQINAITNEVVENQIQSNIVNTTVDGKNSVDSVNATLDRVNATEDSANVTEWSNKGMIIWKK